MKPFNYEAALAGKPICTRSGRDAYLIGTRINHPENPLVGIVVCGDGKERPICFTEKGEEFPNVVSPYDLFMAPEVYKGWINILRDSSGGLFPSVKIFPTKEDAVKYGEEHTNVVIDTIEIRWEE